MVQVEFSEIRVFVDKLEQSNGHDLQAFLESELNHHLNINVNVSVEIKMRDEGEEMKKHNYFVQLMSGLV